MPDLLKSLQGRDLGHLRIVAELWGIELEAPDARQGLQRLLPGLLEQARVEAVVAALPEEARTALDDLLHSDDNRLPWALFSRRYGMLREMGPARRDRDLPHLSPVSPAELLWYRALVARAFFDTPTGPEEFAYIPEDLASLLPVLRSPAVEVLGRVATALEQSFIQLASDRLLDHATTLLAALRSGFSTDQIESIAAGWNTPLSVIPLTVTALKALLGSAGLLDAAGMPTPEPARQFLEASRGEALAMLTRAWANAGTFNELRMLPGLKAEGEWQNDPLRARQSVLDYLGTIPPHPSPVGGGVRGEGKIGSLPPAELPFWSLNAFLQAIRQHYPDFQRPAGDYDSWYLRDESSGEYLRGFESWERVDGALVRYILAGPMHWLGLVDLAWNADPLADPSARLTAFRFSAWADALLGGQPPQAMAEETATILARSDLSLVAPRLSPRAARYQLARFCQWQEERDNEYHYRLTPASLAHARQQGLTTNQLLRLLQRYARTVPPSLVKAIERWERAGVEARLETVLVLRLSTPELLQTVRASKAGRFLGEPLGPTAIIVKAGAMEKVRAILAELGYLAES